MKSIGILGCGMVGNTWLREIPWQELGLEPIVYDPFVGDLQQGNKTTDPAELAETDTVLVFAPGRLAPEAIHSVFTADGRGPAEVLDFSSNGPDGKAQLAIWCAERGCSYIDITILGIVSSLGVRTPLALAGPQPSSIGQTILKSSSAPLSHLRESTAGDAARLKLVRSIVMKGLETLAIEAGQIAKDLQIQDAYESVYRDVDLSSFTTLLNGMTTSHRHHAERRGAEVREVLTMIHSLGRESALLHAVAKNYEEGPFRKRGD